MALPTFDPNKPFDVVEGETLDTLTAPRAPRAPIATPAVASAPSGPTFDPAKPFTAVAEAPAGPVFNPSAPVIKVYGLEEFSAKPVAELVADKDFMPVQFGVQHENELVDPALRTKLEEVYAARERAGTSLKDKVKATFTGIAPAVKTLGQGVGAAARLAEKFSLPGLAKRVITAATDPNVTAQDVVNDYAKSGTEAAASVELAALGSTDLIRRSNRAVGEAIGMLPGDLPAAAAISGVPVRRSKADMTEGDWRNRLSDDIAAAKQVEVAGQGNGAVMEGLGIDAATLERDHGIKVNPEEIAKLSVVTDPINYIPFGAGVGAVTKIGGKAVRLGLAVTQTAEQAAKLAEILNTATAAGRSVAGQVAGTAAKATGGVIEAAGNVAEKGVRALGGTASGVGLGGLLGGNVYSALGGAAVAKGIPRVAQIAGRTIKGAGKILTGEAAAPGALTLAADTLKAGATGAVKGALEGGALILPFEIGARPEEEEQLLGMVGLGAGLRAGAEGARPVARAAGRGAQNQLAKTIFKTKNQVEQLPLVESPTYGTDPLLDSNHAANSAKLSAPEQKLVNWGREFLRDSGGEVYVLDNAAFNRETGSKTARGYAVSIGEKLAPDGTATPVFRILLNQSAEALPHEFFHALTDLDPKRAADFRETVQKSLTPSQLNSFEQLYNSRLNDGLPEAQWTRRLTPEQVANEAAAETFSRLFLSQDLTGVAPAVQQKAALFVSSLLEKAGAPLAATGRKAGEAGVSSLGVRPGVESTKAGQAWLANMLQRVNDEGTLGQPPILPERPATQTPIPTTLVSKKPARTTPATPAPVPAPSPRPTPVNPPLPAPKPAAKTGPRNIRAARQDDFAGRRAEVTNIDAARAAAEATGDANTIARVNELAAIIEAGSPVVEIEHSGVRAAGTVEAPSGRTARRLEQENAYIAEGMANAPESIREAYKKVLVIYKLDVVGGKVQALGMSLDKVIANTHKTVKEAAARGVAERIPYEITDGKLTDNAWGQVVDDLKAYADNQANGYRGDGQKLIRPTEDVGLSIPAENPAYSPRVISEERANFLNMVQGLNPPLTARVGKQSSTVLPGNVKGQILAEVNARQPETPSVIRPEDIKKQGFPGGRSVAETNPLRNELAAAGVPVRELIEVTERINAADINKVTARPELDFKAPVTDTIRGGFLPRDKPGDELPGGFNDPFERKQIVPPKEDFLPPSGTFEPPSGTFEPPTLGEFLPGDTAKQISDVQAMSGDEFTAATRAWDGGLTKRAWDTGLSTKTPEDVLALKVAQESASATARELRAEKKTSEAMPWIYKSQFFREAYEAATDTLSAAGPNGWRNAFPDRTAPFPEAKDRPFAEQKNVVVPEELIAEARGGDFLPTGREWDEIMAKRRAEGAKEKPKKATTTRLTPAMWILPDGEVKALATIYHEQDLASNADDYRKRFGTGFGKDATLEDRNEALNKGFVRVRYAPENGRTTVEVGARQWAKQKPKVLDTLLSGADKIDSLNIHLVGEDGVTFDTVTARVFSADDKAAAITDAVNEVVAPTTQRAKGVAPSDILRARSIPGPGDFLPAEPFYSELQRVIDEKVKGDSIPAKDLAALVRNAGVKPEELKWSGLDDYLAGKSKVSVPELKKFLRENAVQLEEVQKSSVVMEEPIFDFDSDGYEFVSEDPSGDPLQGIGLTRNGKFIGEFGGVREAQRAAKADFIESAGMQRGDPETKFENYQVPGGENYRELLLTLPRSTAGAEVRQLSDGSWRVTIPSGEAFFGDSREAVMKRFQAGRERAGEFKSSHFDEPNVLAHVRFNERRDAAGKKVLFLEEVQSDWHQAGKKKGYAGTLPVGDTLRKESGATGDFYTVVDSRGRTVAGPADTEAGAIQDRLKFLDSNDNRVPDAPFKKTWPLLAVKRMLRYAAENGFDKLAWTPGDIQAARYDLSKQIDAIYYDPDSTRLLASKDNVEVIDKKVPPEDLPDFIGKEAAKKLIESPLNMRGNHQLEGQELRVGGEGMRGFYDQILPKEVGAYVKKWGVKVEKSKLPEPGKSYGVQGTDEGLRPVTIAEAKAAHTAGQPVYAAAPAENGFNYNQLGDGNTDFQFGLHKGRKFFLRTGPTGFDAWSVTLTPSMRTDVLTKGQKMFLPRGGAIGPESIPASVQRRSPAPVLPPLTADDLEKRK